MSNPSRISLEELLAYDFKSRHITLKSSSVRSHHSGQYVSYFKGRGMDYDESRVYQVGDDVRNIDWRVTARTNKTYTKLYKEEKERPIYLWVDYRPHMMFATQGKYKAVVAAELAAMIAWTAYRQGDRLGGIIFSDHAERELKPMRGRKAALRFLAELADHPSWQPSTTHESAPDLSESLIALRRISRPGSLIILVSDFRGFDQKTQSHLLLLGRHSEVVMIFIYDRFEQSLPHGRYYLSDGNHKVAIDTRHGNVYHDYQQRFAQRKLQQEEYAKAMRALFIECRTDSDLQKMMSQYWSR